MIYGTILGFICVILFVLGIVLLAKRKKNVINDKSKKIALPLIIVSVAVFLIFPFSFHQVNTGEVAVVRHLGEIKQTRTAGVYFNFWLTDEYEYYDAKVQQVQIQTPAYSKDGQTLDLEVVIQYQIQQENVQNIATIYGGLEMLESRIKTVSIERIKSVLSEKTAMETIETRNVVSKDVTARVSESISSDYYVDINSVVLTNINFTDDFEKIVEEKVAAEQEAQKAVNEAEKKKTEAEAAKTVAELEADAELYKATKEAEAVKLKAEADAEAAILASEAEAKAITLKSIAAAKMLGYNVIETTLDDGSIKYEIVFDETHNGDDIRKYLEYIAYLASWDGKLPETLVSDDGASIILPSND